MKNKLKALITNERISVATKNVSAAGLEKLNRINAGHRTVDMSTTPTITCRDTDDPEYWAARLNAAEREECEALLDEMLGLFVRLSGKGVPLTQVTDRFDEGTDIYLARFGKGYAPF